MCEHQCGDVALGWLYIARKNLELAFLDFVNQRHGRLIVGNNVLDNGYWKQPYWLNVVDKIPNSNGNQKRRT